MRVVGRGAGQGGGKGRREGGWMGRRGAAQWESALGGGAGRGGRGGALPRMPDCEFP